MSNKLPSIHDAIKKDHPEDVISLNELLKTFEQGIEDMTYDLGRTKSPRNKRKIAGQLRFWKSIDYYLQEYHAITG